MELETGLWLREYLVPQLLEEFKNYKDDFIGTLPGVPEEAIDTDGIKFNKLINTVGFHVNKATPFTPVEMEFEKGLVPWDKLDTDLLTLTDKEARAMVFDRENAYRKSQTDSFKIGLRNYVMQALAPEKETATTPVIVTTGDALPNGRKRMTVQDLLNMIEKFKGLNLPNEEQIYMILCREHEMDLLHERNKPQFRNDIVINPVTGKIERFYELKFFTNNHNVKYSETLELKAQGAVAEEGDSNGSVIYYAPNMIHHVESMTSLYKPMEQDTRSADPTAEFRLHTYGLTAKKQNHGFGAIVSDLN